MIIKKKNNQIKQSENSPVVKNEAKEEKTLSLKEAQAQEIPEEDFSTLDFKERDERRRGDRRRGYRRIDERTLVSRAQEEAENIIRKAWGKEPLAKNEENNSTKDKTEGIVCRTC